MTAASPLLRATELVAGHERPVVGPLSFALGPGEVLGLWGPNGSGKSTLLDAITDSARVFSGSVQRAPGLTLAYQEQRPVRLPAMPLTGRDLLRLAGMERPAAPAAVPSPPASLRTLLGRRLDTLSGVSTSSCASGPPWRGRRTWSCSTSPPTTWTRITRPCSGTCSRASVGAGPCSW